MELAVRVFIVVAIALSYGIGVRLERFFPLAGAPQEFRRHITIRGATIVGTEGSGTEQTILVKRTGEYAGEPYTLRVQTNADTIWLRQLQHVVDENVVGAGTFESLGAHVQTGDRVLIRAEQTVEKTLVARMIRMYDK